MLGLIAIIIMRREYAERYDGIIHSLPYAKYQFLLGRYLALVFVGILFVLPQHFTGIFMQLFVWETPVDLSAYLNFFFVTHLPAIAFFSALSILIAGLTYRYQSVATTCMLAIWFMLSFAGNFITNSHKLYGNLFDFRSKPMFATMDPILQWFPELKLILLNRLVYCCLTVIVLIIMLLLYRRRNEPKTRPVVLVSFVPLGVVVALAVSSYLTDWKSYLEITRSIDIISTAGQGFYASLNSDVVADHRFNTLDYTLTIQLAETNRHLVANALINVENLPELPLPDQLTLMLDSGFEIYGVKDEHGKSLGFNRENDLIVLALDNNQDATSITLQIEYGGEVWKWQKKDLDTVIPIMQFVNTGWLSQYITNRAIRMNGTIYAWYPKLHVNGHEQLGHYKLTVLSEDDKVFISNSGHLQKTGIESGFYRYEAEMTDTAALTLISAPYTYIEHNRVKIYCLKDNMVFAHNLIQYLDDKMNFYERVTNRYLEMPLVIIESDNAGGFAPHRPLLLAHENFNSYIGETYPYKKLGIRPIDVRLTYTYLAHPLDGLLGLGSTALGIGSYIDSLYIKQLGFDSAYDQEREYRLAIAEAVANDQVEEIRPLINRMTQEIDPIQISWLPYHNSTNEVWLELDQIYSDFGFEALCETVHQMVNNLEEGN